MKTIIDTHALIWAVDDPERLGSKARAIIDDSRNEILFSSGSIWESAIKIGLGKLTNPVTSLSNLDEPSCY